MADLGSFASTLCARYAARGTPIAAFEIWNEPKYADGGGIDQGNYFTGTPAALAAMGRAISQAVKAVDANALVLTPSPTGLEFPWVAGEITGFPRLAERADGRAARASTGRQRTIRPAPTVPRRRARLAGQSPCLAGA